MQRHKIDPSFLLQELTEKLTDHFDRQLLQDYGLTFSEWRLLFAVFLAQENPTQEEVAMHAQKSPAAVSRQLNILVEKGLVQRSDSKKSKRIKLVKMTKQGKNVFNKSVLVVGKISKDIFKQLGPDLDVFKDSLVTLIENLEQQNDR